MSPQAGASFKPVSAAAELAPKRVHFNDRTSIRSFESISSLCSNSTAIQANELQALRRQQALSVGGGGSPDSMASGSDAGRLSADSPLRGPGASTRDTGAAIYAIRDDPESEQSVADHQLLKAIGLHTTAQLTRNPYGFAQPQLYQQPQLMAASQRPLLIRQTNGPYLRMTAPPTISSAAALPSPAQSYRAHAPIGQMNFPSPSGSGLVQTRNQPDDEDASYALRLRQAASQRAYQFPTQQPQLVSPQHPSQQPFQRRAPPSSGRQPRPINFQTEV